jgi:1-acyl-sn-glycerol-3-phosphate acyltransferase
LIDRVQREPFIVDGQAIVADSDDAGALEFVACGQPLPGYEVRVIDAAGRELPERRVGRLQFRGPSATRGYLHNEVATRSLIDGPWRETGDRAYLAGGDLYLSGRDKDLIIRGGRNIYPYEVEAAVGGVAGVRKGCVAVFGSMDADAGTERVIVVAETREQDSAVVGELRKRVRDVATDLLGAPPDEVLLAPPHTVLKTSSGKIRRTAVRELFERGDIGQRPRAVWWQLVRLAFAAAGPRLRSAWRGGRDLLFAAYAHLVFWSLAPPAWLLIVLLPQERWRWAVMRQGARLLFRLTGVSPQLKGLEHWPQGQACVIIANHASYLDGVLLVSVLPPSFGFVAKRELSEGMIPRLFLKRIGAVFVERFDQQRSASDAQRTVAMVKAGRSLMYFPEGTFTRIPGLRRFHMGAFVAAAEAAVPLVPVTIQGTRSVLRGDSLFPHHARLGVTVGLPLHPAAADWDAALALRDAARAAILSQLDEPDLLQSGS